METKQINNCSKAKSKNDAKMSILAGITSGFTILVGILDILDTPSEVLFPIAIFLIFVLLVSVFLLFGKGKE